MVVNKVPVNAIWATASDFTYIGYDSTVVGIDYITGEITARKEGVTSVLALHKVTGLELAFQIDVSRLLIYQTGNTYYTTSTGELAEDLIYSDMTMEELRQLDWVNWSDFVGYTPALHRANWENMCTSLFSMGKLEGVVKEMINHFMDGTGADYRNNDLTEAVVEHASTVAYTDSVKERLAGVLNNNGGNIYQLKYDKENRDSNPLILAFREEPKVYEPVYNDNIFSGLTICIDSLWGNKIEVVKYMNAGNRYTCTLHFTLYDHFGLNQPDVEKYGYLVGFRSWYVLQHYSEYKGAYRPFLTIIEFDVTFSGTLGGV
ncbi:MAG: DUF3289 family protein [Agathobacter sp.]|nr:DUF3289 family protein [Agathobacter sp.]